MALSSAIRKTPATTARRLRAFLSLLSILCLLSLSACSMTPQATLAIYNDTGQTLYNVSWNNTNFGTIANGASQDETVKPGTAYIYASTSSASGHSDAQLTVAAGDNIAYHMNM
jgi:hypothetical protein